MKDLAGKFGGAMVWLFALLAIGISFGISKIGISNAWVALIVTSVVFFACAWAGGYMTKAGKAMTIVAMVVATVGYIAVLFFTIMGMAKSAVVGAGAAAAAAGAGGDAAAAALAAGAKATGSAMGIIDFIVGSWKPLAGAVAASIAGAIVGTAMKAKNAPPSKA